MEVQFYIYGVPEGFDLYGGTPNDIGYFQSYYDSSRENAKLTIHRRHNGQVVYSFLCYNLISGSGRTGSFFGMSAVFNGIYCTDTNNLYKLFEGTYKTILQQGILLREANGRIVFATRSLKDVENEISRITGILYKNITNAFAEDFRRLDGAFQQGVNQNVVRRMDVDKGNEAIIQTLKEYPMISVSPEYKEKETTGTVISDEQLKQVDAAVQGLMQKIAALKSEWKMLETMLNVRGNLTEGAVKRQKETEIVSAYSRMNSKMGTVSSEFSSIQQGIAQFLQSQKEHGLLLAWYGQVNAETGNIVEITKLMKQWHPVVDEFRGNQGGKTAVYKDEHHTGKDERYTDNDVPGSNRKLAPSLPKIKFKYLLIVAGVVILAVALWVVRPGGTNTNVKKYLERVRTKIDTRDYIEAMQFCDSVFQYDSINSEALKLKDKARDSLMKKAENSLDSGKYDEAIKKCDDVLKFYSKYKYAKDLKLKAEKERDIANLYSQAQEYFTKAQYGDAIQKCDEIFKLDEGNAKAKELKSNAEEGELAARRKKQQDAVQPNNGAPQSSRLIAYNGNDKTVDEWLITLDEELEKRSATDYVKGGCDQGKRILKTD